jgi:hypothetical protein
MKEMQLNDTLARFCEGLKWRRYLCSHELLKLDAGPVMRLSGKWGAPSSNYSFQWQYS